MSNMTDQLLERLLDGQAAQSTALTEMKMKLCAHLDQCAAEAAKIQVIEKRVEALDDVRRAVKSGYKLLAAIVGLLVSLHGLAWMVHK